MQLIKKILFLCIGLFTISQSLANEKDFEKSKYYVSSEVGAGNYMTYGVDFNYILNDRYTFKLGYSGFVRNSKSLPDEATNFISTPHDIMNTLQLMVGHAIYLSENKKNRVNFSAGIGYTSIDKPGNWQSTNIGQTESYIYEVDTAKEASFILQPKFEFAVEKYFGFTISPTLQISENETYIGIGIGSMLGSVR